MALLITGRLYLDLRSGFHRWRHRPVVSIGSALTIAFAVAVSLTAFCAFRGVYLSPSSYANPERFLLLQQYNSRRNFSSPPRREYLNFFNQHSRSFAGIAPFSSSQLQQLSIDSTEKLVEVQRISPNFFSLITVPLPEGRLPTPENPSGSVLISARIWQQLFSGKPVTGRTLFLWQKPHRITGVLPPGFDLPNPELDVWLVESAERLPISGAMAKLRPGVSIYGAQDELDELTTSLIHQYDLDPAVHFNVQPLVRHNQLRYFGFFTLLILAAAGIFVFAVFNAGTSSLAQARSRAVEFAVRHAFGAARWRVFAQVMIENLVLSLAGGFAGVLIAWLGLYAIRQRIPKSAHLPRLQTVHLDLAGWCFAAAMSVLLSMLLGILPAYFLSKVHSERASRALRGPGL